MKPSILIVEDNQMMLAFLESYLSERFLVTCKTSGADALAWLEEGNRPDVIISDIEMPDLNGFEMLASIKASTFLKRIPVIMLSGKDKSEDRIRSLKMGATDYLTKPFNPEELEIRIDKVITIAA